MPRPLVKDCPSFFEKYISLVDVENIADAVIKYSAGLNSFYTSLPEDKANYAYAPDKWTLKDILQHVIDTERILSYRMMCIARKETAVLPTFDENIYAANAMTAQRSFVSLKEEFTAVRKSSDLLIGSMNDAQLSSVGTSGNNSATANSFGFIIFGHLLHHKNIVEERYL